MADAVHREVAEGTAKVLSVMPLSAPGHTEKASGAFKDFRLAVLHATGSRDLPAEAFLDSVEEKDLIIQFLSEFAGVKRMYRKQIVAVFESLLEVDSWLWILVHNDALAGTLQDEMKDVFEKARAARPNPAPPPAPPTASEVVAAAEPPPPVDGYSLEGLLAKARVKAEAEEAAAAGESAPAPAPAVEEAPAPAPAAAIYSVPATSSVAAAAAAAPVAAEASARLPAASTASMPTASATTAAAAPAVAEASARLPAASAASMPTASATTAEATPAAAEAVESGREIAPPDAADASPPAPEEAADDLPKHSVKSLKNIWESKIEDAAEKEAEAEAEAEAAEKARQQAEEETLAREEAAQKAKEAAEAEAAAAEAARLKAEEEERQAKEAEEAKRKQQEEEDRQAREAKEAAEAEAAAKARQQAEEEERRAREAEEAKRKEEEEKRAREEERQARMKAIEDERARQAAEAERKYAEWIKSEEERKAREAAAFAAMPVPAPAKPEDFMTPHYIWGKTEEKEQPAPPPLAAPPSPPVATAALRMAVQQAWATAGESTPEESTGPSPSPSPSGAAFSPPPRSLDHDVAHTVSQFQEAVDKMQKLNFSAERRDPTSDAFNQFYKAVLKTASSVSKEDDEELERVEPKADIVSFLVDVQTKRSNMESRVGAVLERLEVFDSWRAVIGTHRDPVVTKTVRQLVSGGAAEAGSEGRGRGDAMRPPTSTMASDAGHAASAPSAAPAAAPAPEEPGGLSAWLPWFSSRSKAEPSAPVAAAPARAPAPPASAAPSDTAVRAAVGKALAGVHADPVRADPVRAEPRKEWVVWYSIDPRRGNPQFYSDQVANMLENGRRRGQKSVDITAFMPCEMRIEFEPRLTQQTKGGGRDVIREELSSPTDSISTYVNKNQYKSWQAAQSFHPGAEKRTTAVPSGHAVQMR